MGKWPFLLVTSTFFLDLPLLELHFNRLKVFILDSWYPGGSLLALGRTITFFGTTNTDLERTSFTTGLWSPKSLSKGRKLVPTTSKSSCTHIPSIPPFHLSLPLKWVGGPLPRLSLCTASLIRISSLARLLLSNPSVIFSSLSIIITTLCLGFPVFYAGDQFIPEEIDWIGRKAIFLNVTEMCR